jgi:hypothetical protein
MIRPTMLLIVLLAASLSLTLFVVKYQVQDIEAELVEYNRALTDDRQAIHVLKAEWSYLNQPARLRNLAERYLGFAAIETWQVGTADEFFPILPASLPVSHPAYIPGQEPIR